MALTWSLVWKGKINQVAKIQCKFKKKLLGLEHFSFIERLHELKAFSLEQERRKADLVLIYKWLHNLNDISGVELGFTISRNSKQN